jgi:uncharacterized HAD superfamily protein
MNTGELDDEDDAKAEKPKTSKYDDFMLAEYNNIAQAHFNTMTAIATFFRNYLTFVGLPIPILVGVLTKVGPDGTGALSLGKLEVAVPLGATLIGLIGICVMIYIVNLRCDALLYARTVNGIRHKFYSDSRMRLEDEMVVRVLPRSTRQPSYFDWHYSFSVVAVFAIVDTAYPLIGWYWYLPEGRGVLALLILGAVAFVGAHFALYWRLASYRETGYLRAHIIGVDLDGVLNNHRQHFAATLQSLRRKTIDPEKITAVPVHKSPDLNVTEIDEQIVFNSPSYWIDMPVADQAATMLQKIKRGLAYKVIVFTHRPWPQQVTGIDATQMTDQWLEQGGSETALESVIDMITKRWLERHSIPHDELVIEKDRVDGRSWAKNRINLAATRGIRIFVEDNLFNAKKLASICEIVFLVDHPYNQIPENELPNNIKRVKSWGAISDFITQNL